VSRTLIVPLMCQYQLHTENVSQEAFFKSEHIHQGEHAVEVGTLSLP